VPVLGPEGGWGRETASGCCPGQVLRRGVRVGRPAAALGARGVGEHPLLLPSHTFPSACACACLQVPTAHADTCTWLRGEPGPVDTNLCPSTPTRVTSLGRGGTHPLHCDHPHHTHHPHQGADRAPPELYKLVMRSCCGGMIERHPHNVTTTL